MKRRALWWLVAASALWTACGEEQTPDSSPREDMSSTSDMVVIPDLDIEDVAQDISTPDDMPSTEADLPGAVDMAPDASPTFEPPVVKVLGEGALTVFERTFQYKLLELTCGDKVPTYAQWIEPEASAARPFPVVAMTQPYAGIGWTGQEVDARWAARGPGLHPDDSEPGFVAGSGAVIGYEQMTPQQGGEQGAVHLINGFGVLHMFGRFYAGGSIQNDVDDMTCGLSYLAIAPGADTSRIGTWGGSWGGFEAVYGALYAPAEVAPKLGVALTPLTDFDQEWRFADAAAADPRPAVAQQFASFFEPYKRRIAQTTGGAPGAGDFAGFVHADLERLPNQTRFLSIHDAEDALVPFTMNQGFAEALGERVEPVWLMSAAPLDLAVSGVTHGLRVGGLYISLITLSSAYLQTALAEPGRQLLIVYEAANLKAMLGYTRAQKDRGQGTQAMAARLIELADPRVILFEVTTGQATAGAEVVSALVNEVFETGYTPFTVGPGLRRNGL